MASDGDRTYNELNAAMHHFALNRGLDDLSVSASHDPHQGWTNEFVGRDRAGNRVEGFIADQRLCRAIAADIGQHGAARGLSASINDKNLGPQRLPQIRIRYDLPEHMRPAVARDLPAQLRPAERGGFPGQLEVDGRIRVRGPDGLSRSAEALSSLLEALPEIMAAARAGDPPDPQGRNRLVAQVCITIGQGVVAGANAPPLMADEALKETLQTLGFEAKCRLWLGSAPAGVAITAVPKHGPMVKAVLNALGPHMEASTNFTLHTSEGDVDVRRGAEGALGFGAAVRGPALAAPNRGAVAPAGGLDLFG
ncbi:MAG: hypothetical protein ACR2GX_01925 [Candidatus Dormibacteria bacterium]